MYAASGMSPGNGLMPQPQRMLTPPPHSRSSEAFSEVTRLRQQLEHEQAETNASQLEYSKRIESITQENKKLQMKLMRSQLRDSAKDSEVAVVKKEVLEKTAAIEQVMRDLQQRQQATLSRVKNVANAMVTACSTPSRERNASPAQSSTAQPAQASRLGVLDMPVAAANGGHGLPDAFALQALSRSFTGSPDNLANGRSPSAASLPPRRREASGGRAASASPDRRAAASEHGAEDADEHRWFQSVKANLEHFGNVEVFMDNAERDCACCLESMGTPYGIRPRRCQHVFHIECLLQWWTEGTCPVCSLSFAPDPDRVARTGGGGSSSPLRALTGGGGGGGGAVGSPSGARSLLTRPAGVPGPGTFGGPENALAFRARVN